MRPNLGRMSNLFDTRREELIATANSNPGLGGSRAPMERTAPKWLEWRGTGCILVIDDEDAVRTVVTRAVAKLGFTAKSASDGLQAIAQFEADPSAFSLVLLDLRLPAMGGGEIIRRLRLLRADVPIILMSGYGTQEAIAQLTGQDIAAFLHKPFTMDTLASKIRGVLEPSSDERAERTG